MNKAKVVVVVDGCSTGTLLAQEFNRNGFRCVHIQSSVHPPAIMTGAGGYHPHEYMAAFAHDGNMRTTLALLAPFDVVAVMPGAEPGVELADALAAAIGVPCNVPELSAARRDKFRMTLAVAAAGLRTIPTIRTHEPGEALAWIDAGIGFPVVVKPPQSGGTDGVTLCEDAQAVHAAFATLLGRENILALVNDQLVVQAYISGVEYIVDTVSMAGVHQVTDIWEYGKRRAFGEASFVYDHAWLLPAEGPKQAALSEYARRVLDALGIRHGAAHCEIMLSAGEPVLIEVGARICGGYVPLMCKTAIGFSQVDALVESIASPGRFKDGAARPYALHAHALRVLLISGKDGRLRGLPRLKDVYVLRSFHAMQLGVQPGGRIERTTNFFTHPGKVDLMHADQEVLLGDMQAIRDMEATGFYDIKEDDE